MKIQYTNHGGQYAREFWNKHLKKNIKTESTTENV